MPYRISADTGGTFIDVVVGDETGRKTIGKSLTTHDRVSRGLLKAIANAAESLGVSPKDLLDGTDLFVYGTTRATNAIVTRNAARTAFIATRGFGDTLVLKEGGKHNGQDFSKPYPDPYIPRSHTFEVSERVAADGRVIEALDERDVRRVLKEIADREFEAIAVCLLWSVVNAEHEQLIGELIADELPGIPFTLSHDIAPVVREYRRASAAAIDASLKPLMQKHFTELERDLREAGYAGQLLVSTSAGGVMSIDEVVRAPINSAKSGPAMAPLAGVTYSLLEGCGGDMIVCDTGGTTFDVGLSRDSELVYTRETWLGTPWEGDLLGISSVDIRSVGAGGGSIAWVDEGGLLRVGPQSAGSEPGPACYGNGGLDATVSDAACVLGYFDPDYFLGGKMTLDRDAAERAVNTIAERLGISTRRAAWGILALATDGMVKAVHEITISQGLDPKESAVVAGGGASGLNILRIASELEATRVIIPKTVSALSATGMQFADILKEESSSCITSTDRFDFKAVNATLDALEHKLRDFASRMNVDDGDITIEYFTEARYAAQVWDLDVPLTSERFTSARDVEGLIKQFGAVHERVFAIRDDEAVVECLNWKARLTVTISAPPQPEVGPSVRQRPTASSTRPCYFGDDDTMVDTPIFKPEVLPPGAMVHGPAIVEEPTTTLVVYPGQTITVSPSGNYLLSDEASA